ncbi:hypothetical protein CC86DRAFT_204168 [Ophiobolus disseminans]|uniref:Uncharacterized protein n=1 Tax=Ophiobolus disseminans TaxID=1469910 RepID=A0A6A7A443_9PLEO|nr:hypothetical protein CC86DRAFT_204168 [Ophiobolus disseminans]
MTRMRRSERPFHARIVRVRGIGVWRGHAVSCVACHTPRHAACGTCPRKRWSKDRVGYKKCLLLVGWYSHHTISLTGLASVLSLQVHLAPPISTPDVRSMTANGEVSDRPWPRTPDTAWLSLHRSGCRHQAQKSLSLRIGAESQPHSNGVTLL